MSEQEGYNGWKNYETWCMALWIDNDEGSYTWSREIVREAAKLDDDEEAEAGGLEVGAAAAALKDWQEEQMPELEASVWLDLLSAAFSEIDWYEIAENYLSEMSDA